MFDTLKTNQYPGRGIVLGLHEDGRHAVIGYFIMGRSAGSRNRWFVPEGEGLRTEAVDESMVIDPSLIIYAPVRVLPDCTVVTNGDQTDTVYDALRLGGTFEAALRTREFEPDPPIFTPRISGMIQAKDGKCAYRLSILKGSNNENGYPCQRFFYEYEKGVPGVGHLIHTYAGNGNPVPSFHGEPVKTELCGSIDELAAELWGSLNEDNRVSLFVRYIDIETGKTDTRIINRFEKESV